MLIETTQEILGTANTSEKADAVRAYYQEISYFAENEEDSLWLDEALPPAGILFIGSFFPKKENKIPVLKFHAFLTVHVYSKEHALALWKGKVAKREKQNVS